MPMMRDGAAGEEPRRVRVLLVEDETLIVELMAEVLTEHGFEVEVATDAAAALAHLAADRDVDVLFTDVNLGDGMDGAELARQARALRPELPVVYASGRHTAATIASRVSHSLFLNKPYRPEEACKLIGRLAVH